MTDDRYTRWAVIGAGEGGGRIAAGYFTRTETSGGRVLSSFHDNPSIEDRILIINTNRSDLRNIVDEVRETISETHVQPQSDSRTGTVDKILDDDPDGAQHDSTGTNTDQAPSISDHTHPFGPLDGVGNDFERGEFCAEEGFERIVNRIQSNRIYEAQALLYYTTFGGGTGNGSVPYLIRNLKHNPPIERLDSPNIGHVAFGVWPYDHNGAQQHFNAVCGLSRLLRWYNGDQNADMVLLASNTHVSETFAIDRSGEKGHAGVNELVRSATDMIIGAGREATRVIDTQDYIRQPSNINAYYFTPGLALEQQSLLDLPLLFELAANNTFVPMDPTTAQAVYVVLRVPEAEFKAGKYTQESLSKTVSAWLEESGYDQVSARMQTIIPHYSSRDTVDVLTLFGGFDLGELLDGSLDQFHTHYERAVEEETADDGGLTSDEYRDIKQNLETFLDREL